VKTASAARTAEPNRADQLRCLATRDAFTEAIPAFTDWQPWEPEPKINLWVDFEPIEITISEACGLVWRCKERLPSHDFDRLLECGIKLKNVSYSAAARALRTANKIEERKNHTMNKMTEEQYRLERDCVAFLLREFNLNHAIEDKIQLLTDPFKFVGIAEYCGLGLELAQQLEKTQDEALNAMIEGKGRDEPWFKLLEQFSLEINLRNNPFPPDWPLTDKDIKSLGY
jgi:hypothetical protein